MQFKFFLLLGIGLGILAAAMAYLITYEEYRHHFQGRRVHVESLKSAIVTLIFFVILAVAIGFALGK